MAHLAVIVGPNSHVTLDYVLKDDAGEILDTSDGADGEPIEYIHGYGMLVPGLEAGLVGLRVGDERTILVPSEEGYGDRDEELVMEVDRGDFPDPEKVAEGDEFVAESPGGDEVVMRVVELRDDAVVVDANHPLAGVTLHYAIKILTVRAATDDEITAAAADFEDAGEHQHGPGCSHSHEEGDSELVTLGRKKAPLAN